ncbi:F-box/kelch-repeat protein At3g23880-like [Bidens hawaiensis]|uniref:F-box/kelch-repeat protein At3g23880-like n=1 Tax=Bidens hawaiensis TaxID=980011 RepID=UPI00404B3025
MACVLPQLPIEIIQSEVLPRLPAKSIGRFRCVCKSWKSFLCSPGFARSHIRYNTKYKLLLLDQPTRTFRTLDCEPVNHTSITTRPIPFKDDVVILASLDGLVCVAVKNTRELAFWNPLTGAYKKIYTKFVVDMSDAFTFYIDSSSDYKLLQIVSNSGEGFIYSRRLDSWRKIPCLENNIVRSFIRWQDISLGEKVYFKLESWRSGAPQRSLISFDVESEKFKEIQFPPLTCGASFGMNLVALNSCIHLCVVKYIPYGGFRFDMWRMDGDEWIKIATFDSPSHWSFRHIYIRRNGNWLAIWEDNNSYKNIDLEDHFKDLYYFFHGRFEYEQRGVIYMETLVSPAEGQRH